MADLEKFRKETRAWLEANCPGEMRKPMTAEDDTFWGGRNAKFSSEPQRIWFERMRDKGWTVPHWPKEYGGGRRTAAADLVRHFHARAGAAQIRHGCAEEGVSPEDHRRPHSLVPGLF